MKLWKQTVFFALSACLSSSCMTSAPPPVPVNAPPTTATPAGQTAQPNAPATGHDHADHALEDKMPRLNAEELRRLLAVKQAVVVDVRSAEEYAQAHIEGAINLPIQQIETGQYPKLPRGQRLISYCT
jgi:hypothetical protein